ncbi:MAG: hypothetical protein NZR01_11940 [Bryobacteraceae bacterium]|nr:hypothetical protein [Bryobacteraceae bacterium]
MLRADLMVVGLASVLLAVAQPPARLGAPAPDWTVETAGGERIKLSHRLRERKRDAVVLAPREGELPPRAALEESAGRLGERDADLLVLPPGEAAEGVDRPAVLLVDAGAVLRRIENGRLPAGKDLGEFIDEWRLGRDVFLTACARCHGDDGSLQICGDVKPLTGIGNRLTAAQVYERLRPGVLGENDVLIRGRFHKRKEVEAVVVFVRGL